MTTSTTAHIINHTHWDREWFLTSEYTSRWIPHLIDKIAQLANENPDYRFLFDGQTLVIEDLLAVAPNYVEKVRGLLQSGALQLGPYYCQPDWQLTGGELLIRNLMLGRQDVEGLGGQPSETGWLVDTFGHIGQAPQIHRLLDINAVYIWRGSPLLEPYFTWRGADKSELLAINLFGGYRNLYGVTHAPEVAGKRLQTEIEKLAPYYPTPDIPLFDGYDLEDDPEDPVQFYRQTFPEGLEAGGRAIELHEATPASFARDVAQRASSLPTVDGELNSGKYGATFPGTFSARTYLKLMAHDCERLLFSVVEPLAVMARLHGRPYPEKRYETWTRKLLQNAVHDCICGVSIDQVHEKMVDSYRRLHDAMIQDIETSLARILANFRTGTYAISTTPFTMSRWQTVGDRLLHCTTEGMGVWPVAAQYEVETMSQPAAGFTWENEHYTATVQAEGLLHLDGGRYGAIVVSREHGDTYSVQTGKRLGVIRPGSPPILVQRSARHAVVRFQGVWRGEQEEVSVDARLHFDPSPVIRWEIDLDSRGADLRVDMIFSTGLKDGSIYAAMPFEVVQRATNDRDLLPADLPQDLSNVLLGQRELHSVAEFPFHDFVALQAARKHTVAVLSKGLRTYRADGEGNITLTLRRAVEWVTKADLADRIGDAGPFFYVPDARCERRVRHEIGLIAGHFEAQSMALQQLNAAFQNPPLIVRVQGRGRRRRWQFLQESLPLSSLSIRNGAMLARFYNPTKRSAPFSRPYCHTDLWGNGVGDATAAPPARIMTVTLPSLPDDETQDGNEGATVTLLTSPRWRVGGNKGQPDSAIMHELQQKIEVLASKLKRVQNEMDGTTGAGRLRLQHQVYVLEREMLEFKLSLELNQRKLEQGPSPDHDYLYGVDPDIAEIGQALNRLRIKRRIFDYVVQAI